MDAATVAATPDTRAGSEIARLGELVSEAVGASYAEATKRAYARTVRQFEAWALERGQPALPRRPETVAAYLADRADRGASISTVRADAAGIAAAHRAAGHDTPTARRASAPPCAGSPASGQATGAARRKRSPTTRSQRSARQPASPVAAGAAHLEIPANAEARGKPISPLRARLRRGSAPGRARRARLGRHRGVGGRLGPPQRPAAPRQTGRRGRGRYLSPQTMRDPRGNQAGRPGRHRAVFALGPAHLSRRIAAAARRQASARASAALRQGRPRAAHDRQGSPNSGRDATRPMGQPRDGRQLHPRRDRRPGRPIPHMNRPPPGQVRALPLEVAELLE